jgi:hypothetical protein
MVGSSAVCGPHKGQRFLHPQAKDEKCQGSLQFPVLVSHMSTSVQIVFFFNGCRKHCCAPVIFYVEVGGEVNINN